MLNVQPQFYKPTVGCSKVIFTTLFMLSPLLYAQVAAKLRAEDKT
jgi:hypothetical protein